MCTCLYQVSAQPEEEEEELEGQVGSFVLDEDEEASVLGFRGQPGSLR